MLRSVNEDGLSIYFSMCRHREQDQKTTLAFLHRVKQRNMNADIIFLLRSLIRKQAQVDGLSDAQKAVFGQYAEVDTVSTRHIRQAIKEILEKEHIFESVFEFAVQLINQKCAKSRLEYISGSATLNVPQFTNMQMLDNAFLFKVLPSLVPSLFEKFSKLKNGKIFSRLHLLKFYDPLNVIPRVATQTETQTTMRILKDIHAGDNTNMAELISAIRASRPSLIDESSKLVRKTEAKRNALLEEQQPIAPPSEEKVAEPFPVIASAEETKPENTNSTKSGSQITNAGFSKLFYQSYPEKLKYLRPEVLTADYITENERNCMIAFEVNFVASAITMYCSDMEMGMKLVFVDILLFFARDREELSSKLATIYDVLGEKGMI